MSPRGNVFITLSIPNNATTRHQRLRRDFDVFRRACEDGEGTTNDAQDALKRCLETIHELQDDPGWSRKGQTKDESGNWLAHIGARNGAHHRSERILEWPLNAKGLGTGAVRWVLPPDTIRAGPTRDAYVERLHRRAVLPPLRELMRSVAARVPI